MCTCWIAVKWLGSLPAWKTFATNGVRGISRRPDFCCVKNANLNYNVYVRLERKALLVQYRLFVKIAITAVRIHFQVAETVICNKIKSLGLCTLQP